MYRERNTPLLLALVACILVVIGALVTALVVVGQRPVVVVVPPNPGNAAAPAAPAPAAAPIIAPAAPRAAAAPAAAPKAPEVIATKLSTLPPANDVFAPSWRSVPSAELPLQPQQTTTPSLEKVTISSATVQAAHDGKRIAWRISWPAPRPTARADSGEFPDAVAIQFQMADGAPFTMGAKGLPVRILHWKSLWQKDIDDGFQDVQVLHPNSHSDMYWFTEGNSGSIPSFKSLDARQYLVALSAGNPMADLERKVPIEEIAAEGFGTVTTVKDSISGGRGEWKDGRWTVVIDRPLDQADPLAQRLKSAGAAISLAVWDGSAQNRGGRKHWCAWIPLKVEP